MAAILGRGYDTFAPGRALSRRKNPENPTLQFLPLERSFRGRRRKNTRADRKRSTEGRSRMRMRRFRVGLAATALALALVPLAPAPAAQAHAHQYLCPAEFPYGVLRAVIANACRIWGD